MVTEYGYSPMGWSTEPVALGLALRLLQVLKSHDVLQRCVQDL
jgi:hypothetical protein